MLERNKFNTEMRYLWNTEIIMTNDKKPEFYEIDGIKYCRTECPFFKEVRPDFILATCSQDGKMIEINGCHLAHCQAAKE